MDLKVKDILLQSYNRNAKLRDKQEIEDWKLKELNRFASFFEFQENVSLLDLGAGAGQHGEYLNANGFNVCCIDISPEMIKVCQKKGLNAKVMDFYSLEFENDSFDAIWSMNALLHVPKNSLNIVLNNMRNVLKSNGLCYLGLYGGYDSEGVWEEDPYTPNRFFSFFKHEDILKRVESYFEIVHFEIVPMAGMGVDYQSMILRKVEV